MQKTASRFLGIVFIFFLIVFPLYAMPPLNGGPVPDFPPGVNEPSANAPARDEAQIEGEWNFLLILVDFEDYPWNNQDDENFDNEQLLYDVEHFQEMMFSDNSFAYPGSESEYTGSMRDYYNEISGGMYTVAGVATRWRRAPRPYSYYVGDNYGTGRYPNNSQRLVEDIIEIVDEDVDFSEYDNDGDGIVDALAFVHAGPGAEEFGRNEVGAQYIWSHKWSIWNGEQYDGVEVQDYNMNPQSGTIGVFCHEFGHSLGLPDLYDIDYSSVGVGEYALMGSGGWNARPGDPPGTSPAHMIGWSKHELGWVEMINVEENMPDVEIAPIVNEPIIYRLWTNGDDRSEQYFLIENRRQLGFDAGLVRRQIGNDLPAPEGLLITHIDESRRGNRNEDNADETHRLLDIEEASVVWLNGRPVENMDLPRGGDNRKLYNSNRGDNGDLFPGFAEVNDDTTDWAGDRNKDKFGISSVPSSAGYSGRPSMVEVENIRLEGENVIAGLNVEVPDLPVLFIAAHSIDDSDGGNDNDNADPGETIELAISLENIGGQDGVSVSANIMYEGYLAEIEAGETEFPDIPAGQVRMSDDAFVINISEDVQLESVINFTINIVCNEDIEYSYLFGLEIIPEHEWYKYADNPVLSGDEGNWDKNITSPALGGGEDELQCWYVGYNNDLNPPSFGSIGYAESLDGGLTWTKDEDPVIVPDDADWMNGGVFGIGVMSLPGMERIMLIDARHIAGQDTELVIGMAVSENGEDWEALPDPVIEADGQLIRFIQPSQLAVFPYMDGVYGCLFPAVTIQGAALAFAMTEDLENWQINPMMMIPASGDRERFDAQSVSFPEIYMVDENEPIRILYGGLASQDHVWRLGLYLTDGYNIEAHDGLEEYGAILVPGGGWDGEEDLLGGRYFQFNGQLRMLYTGGTPDRTASAVGLAVKDLNVLSVPDDSFAGSLKPRTIFLDPAYPNPFNDQARLVYRIGRPGMVKLSVFDVHGRLVKNLIDQKQSAGSYQTVWNGLNSAGAKVSSGVYFVRLGGGESVYRKVVLIR